MRRYGPEETSYLGTLQEVSAADAAAVNRNGIKTLLGLITFSIKGHQVFSSGPKSLPQIILIILFYSIEFLIILY